MEGAICRIEVKYIRFNQFIHRLNEVHRKAMTKDLEKRLDAIESRLAIDALIAGYAEAFDSRNEQLLESL